MGQANALNHLLDCAQILKNEHYDDITFLLFGDGYQISELKQLAKDNELNNVLFKGKVDRKYIPSILSKGDLNIFTGKSIPLYKYGLSLNKLFDYLGSGKPVLTNIVSGYDLLRQYGSGKTVPDDDPVALADGILEFYNMPKEQYDIYCQNALRAAEDFDFKVLTRKLIRIIEDL